MRIETDRLIVRNFELKDKHDLMTYMLQRVNERFEAYPDFTKEKAESEIISRSKSDEFYAIELKSEGKVIGNIYMGNRPYNSKELGFVLNKEYARKGYCTEASKAVIRWFFENGVHRIFAKCTPLNIASWKTMEKIGMKREGELRENISFHKDESGNPIYWDTYIYGLLSSDM